MPVDTLLTLLVLRCADVQRSLMFYAQLGIAFQQEKHGNGPVHYSAQLGSMLLEIYPSADGSAVDTTLRIGFRVSDLNQTLDALACNGTVITSAAKESAWGRRAVVRDPDGRAVELYEQ